MPKASPSKDALSATTEIEELVEQNVIVESVEYDETFEFVPATRSRGRPRRDTASTVGGSSPRKRRDSNSHHSQPVEVVHDIRRSSRRTANVETLDSEGYYPCPFETCSYVDETRAGRQMHLKNEHPGMKAQTGAGAQVKTEPVDEENVPISPTPTSPAKSTSTRGRGRPRKSKVENDIVPVATEVPRSNRGRKRKTESRMEEYTEVIDEVIIPTSSPRRTQRGRKTEAERRIEMLDTQSEVDVDVLNMQNTEEDDRMMIENEQNIMHYEEHPRRELMRRDLHLIRDDDMPGPSHTVVVEGGEEIHEEIIEDEELDIEDDYDEDQFVEIDVEVENEGMDEYKPPPLVGRHLRDRSDGRQLNLNDDNSDDRHMRSDTMKARTHRLRYIGDPNGRYPCYIETCQWRGNYRSVRCSHMRNVHPDWERPPRFILNRISADGTILVGGDSSARYGCFIEGCPWRGNYRASRSNHMRTVHKDWRPTRTRAQPGGFVPNGRYHCHVEECGWRGMSRSTRAVHMKREHPGFVNPVYTPRNIPCADCGQSLSSHKMFVDHMVVEHKIGGIVQREFTDVRDYEDWFDAVQDSFNIDFIKRMGVKNGPTYQILYLYCARSGGFSKMLRKLETPGVYVPKYNKGIPRRGNKCGRNCAAFLRVMHWSDGKLSIIGCVEHTGHRLGTALLRLSPIEREGMDEYLYMMDDSSPLDMIVDRLREIEGFTADGYQPKARLPTFIAQFVLAEKEPESYSKLIQTHKFFGPDNTFAVQHPKDDAGNGLTLGIMNAYQKDLWTKFATKGVCIEEVRLVLGHWDLRVFIILVLDEGSCPRVACIYISHNSDKRPLFKHLKSVWNGPIATMVTDCTPEYPALFQEYFGESNPDPDMQLAEWHLMAEWAATIEAMVTNRVDKFTIVCVLRRLLRTPDTVIFDATINELFDALKEMQLDDVAQFIDNQLMDTEGFKRWIPTDRNELTDHNNPTLEFACRMLRDRFLSCDQCSRLDEYIGLLTQRVEEFNSARLSAVYATREPDAPRVLPEIFDDDENWPSSSLMDQCTDGMDMDMPSTSNNQRHMDQMMVVQEAKKRKMDSAPTAMHLSMRHLRDVEVVEEIVEEEVVDFDGEEIIDSLAENEELIMEELPDGKQRMRRVRLMSSTSHAPVPDRSMSGRPSTQNKKQKLMSMMAILQEKLKTMNDDDSIELVETNLEQVVNSLQIQQRQKSMSSHQMESCKKGDE